MSKQCEDCGNVVIEPAQILNSHQEHGAVLCVRCHIERNTEDGAPETSEQVPEVNEELEDTIPEQKQEMTTEEKLKIAELKNDYGYDTETAVQVMNAACKQMDAIQNSNVAHISSGYIPKLTIQDVKMYVCPLATDQEAYVFLELCKARGLNPFTSEVYLIKYKDSDPAQAVVGKETFTRKAEQNGAFAGFEAGIIVRNEAGEVEERSGTFYLQDEQLLGGWARVHRKDREYPFVSKVSIKEYEQRKRDGTLNKFWATKAATMIRKVALCQSLREAFPSEFGGLYDRSEIDVGEGESF